MEQAFTCQRLETLNWFYDRDATTRETPSGKLNPMLFLFTLKYNFTRSH